MRFFSVLSFRFAEQVHYLSRAQTVGPEYFKSAWKCGLFTVHDERTEIQTNYLIGEADQVGKGANTVINLLDHYLETNPTEVVVLFADNCYGQNKNNALLHYLLQRSHRRKNVKVSRTYL